MQPNQLCNSRYTFNRKKRATTEHILDRIFRKNAGDNEKASPAGRVIRHSTVTFTRMMPDHIELPIFDLPKHRLH
ncbi:MAG: hypothetical protein GY792_27095 [Gammaproteobacteria bacterium]|nr:hypothetical protein [Gammaproteobacteria bacterium]